MIRRPLALLLVMLASCGRADAPADAHVGATRKALVPAPGSIGAEYAKDGRLAFSSFIDGKAAVFVTDSNGEHRKRVSFGVWDTGPKWSPDGKWILFARDAGGQGDVLIVPSDSGAERAVAASAANESPNAWLPDGSGALFSRVTERGTELWVYHLADGRSEQLFTADGSVDGYPSPDGKWIAYTLTKNGKPTVWLWDREKKTHKQLTSEGFENVQYGCFSPDSRSILYRSGRTGTGDIWRLDVASGERRQLTQDIAEDFNPRWSPDGSRVLFLSTRGGQTDIWTVTTGEQDVQRVTDDAVAKADPQWTNDGRSIVASVFLGQQHLYSMPLDGGTATALTSGPWAIRDAQVSPDGSEIAYTGTKNGDEDVWVIPASGGEARLVTGAPGFDGDVTWSPDAKRLGFVSVRAGNPDIWTVAASGGAATRLTDWPSSEINPRWSPDGKAIAFRSSRESNGWDVWTMPAGGGQATRVTKLGTVNTFRWSPDSKSIAIAAEVGSQAMVFVVPSSGGTPRPLAPPTSLSPGFSPDGRELKLMQCDKGYCTIDIWSVEGKRLRTLTTRPSAYEFDLKWSANGANTLVGWQDLLGDGGNRVDLRPSAGGSGRTLAGPAGFSMLIVGFAAGDKAAILTGVPNGNVLQRIDVSSAVQTQTARR